MCKEENNIPRCQKIQNEYKAGLTNLRETIAEIKMGIQYQLKHLLIVCLLYIERAGLSNVIEFCAMSVLKMAHNG